MELHSLIANDPKMKCELLKLQSEAAKDLTDFMKNTSQNSSNSESYSFTRGVKFGRFAVLTELNLGVNVYSSMDAKPSTIEIIAGARVYTPAKEHECIKNGSFDTTELAKGIYSEDSIFYPEKTICAHCDNEVCFCEEAVSSKAMDN